MKYIVEGRVNGRWIMIGQPYAERAKAAGAVEAAFESGLWEDSRILVVKDKVIVEIIQ